MTDQPKREVIRRILKTGVDFEKFVEQTGRPKFAITASDGPDDVTDLCDGEWLFSDDVHCLIRALLRWEERGIYLQYQEPESDDVDGYWEVVGLPEYFNHAAATIATCGSEDQASDTAQQAFFNVVMADAYSYGFFALQNDCFASYIEDWKDEDDRH
ncbi:hypothetical protein PQR14_36520 [Paraburkholderia bryophila]|uniref:hypothetical protein n=1 Tax=Paraburkholderia bryophila TaxID=420952 RepID=UPI0038B914FE